MSDIRLIEGRARRMQLTSQQLEELVSAGRELAGRKVGFFANSDADSASSDAVPSTVTVVAAGNSAYAVTVKNAIGVLSLSGLTLRVLPKIEVSHFLYIASHALALDPRLAATTAGVAPESSFEDLLARAIVAESLRVTPTGLPMDYSVVPYEDATVRGRIDVVGTARLALQGRLRVAGLASELLVDTAANRVIKEAISRISANSRLSEEARVAARSMRRTFESVGSFRPTDVTGVLHRGSLHFSRLLQLSKVLVTAGGIGLHAGAARVESFLISTPLLVEDGVRQILRARLAPLEVGDRGGGKIVVKRPQFRVNPDLLIHGRSITGDVKYRVAKPGWSRTAVAQAVMFASAFGSPVGFVLGFTDEIAEELPALPLGAVKIHEVRWPATAAIQPELAAERVAAHVKKVVVRTLSLQ